MNVEEYLTKDERSKLIQEINSLADVGFAIKDRDTGAILAEKDNLPERPAFFARAKLWRVVQSIVRAVFLPQLLRGDLYFTDDKGGKYYLGVAKTVIQ